jgi:hypothetical protein
VEISGGLFDGRSNSCEVSIDDVLMFLHSIRKLCNAFHKGTLLEISEVATVLSSEFLSIAINVFVSSFRQGLKIVSEMDQVAVLSVDSDVILIIFIFSDVRETLLKVKGISHQVEEHGQEEVTPVLFKALPSGIFTLVYTVTPSVALRDNLRPSSTDHVSGV